MNHLLKRGLALLCMLALLLCMIPAAASAADLGEFTILSTTDMHGRCWDVNLLTGGSVSNSMLNVSSAVASVRNSKSNVILIDNGDLYQGTPISGYHLTQLKAGETTDPNPMALCLAEIKYDISVIGNHEFNYSWDVMEQTRSYLTSKGVSTLCANLYYDGTDGVHAAGTNVFTPYLIKEITAGGKTVKVAIIGFENTDCPRWDVSDNYPGIVFSHPDNAHGSIAWEADKYIKEVKAKGADAIIISYHSGLGAAVAPDDIVFGSNSENQVLSMIANNTDIDLVIAGHDHSSSYSGNTYKDKAGKDVLVVNGGGGNLTCTTFGITDSGVYVKEHKDIALSSASADAALKEKIRPYAEAAEVYVNRSVGKLVGTWNTVSNYYLAQSDAMDLINRAQIDRGTYYLAQKYRTADEIAALKAKTGLDHITVDFSATSMVISGNYKVAAGEMSMKDIYKLYKYDNTLYLVPLTGQQIKDIMEFVASERLSVNTMSGTPTYGTKGDDFTNPIFYGLDFVYDMSKEVGSRVVISKFADGRAFDLNKTYIMAINNYHLGNGPFAAYSTEDAIWSQVDDSVGSVPDLIAEFITAETASKGGVSPAPSSWSLIYTGEIGGGGTATGAYIGTLVDDPSTLSDGDQILIFHIAGSQLVTANIEGTKLAPSADVNSGGKQIGTNDATAIFRVKKGSDGKFRFLDADGKFMTYGQTGNSLTMSGTETDYAQWEFEAVNTPSNGVVHVHCVNAAYNGNYNQYLEFYGGNFTTYGIGNGGGAYEYMIFRLGGGSVTPTEPTTAPTEPTTAPTEPTEAPDGSFVLSSSIKGGDEVVIYSPGHGMAIKDENDNNWYLVPEAVQPTGNKIYEPSSALVWTVVDNGDGTFSFTNGADKIVCWVSGNYFELTNDANYEGADGKWKVTWTDGLAYIQHATFSNSYGPAYIECYYNSSKDKTNVSGYSSSDPTAKAKDFGWQFFVKNGGGSVTPTTPTNPTDPTAPTEPTEPFTPTGGCQHTYVETKVAATCTEPGYILHKCSKCGDSYRTDFTELASHNYVNGVCSNCGAADPNYNQGGDEPVNPDAPLYASFVDLDKEGWYRFGIDYCLQHGLMNGVGRPGQTVADHFEPNGKVTRAMLVTIVYRAAGEPNAKGLKIPFEDVESGVWYTSAVAWAADQEIVKGVSEEEFAPYRYITREQLAAILYRYAGEPEAKGNLAGYVDARRVSEYALDAMKWAIGEGIITGIDGRLAPQEYATRAQIATMMFRFLDPEGAKAAQEILDKDPNPFD